MLHNTPFGDIVDTEDDMQPYAWKGLDQMDRIYRLLAAVIGTLEVDRKVLRERALGSFATVTELADTLVGTGGLSFRKAHQIVSSVVKKALAKGLRADQVTLALVNEAAGEIIGRNLLLDEETLKKSLDPVHFVAIRSLPGGPSPSEITRVIRLRQAQLADSRQWLQAAREKCRCALQHLDDVLAGWSER
jgi:argininosuccinate lyase